MDRTGKHQASSCPAKNKPWTKPCELLDSSGKVYGKVHHKSLHGSKVAYCNTIYSFGTYGWSAAGSSSYEESLLPKVSQTSKEPEVEKIGRAPTEQELQEVDNSFTMIPVQLVDCKLEIKMLIMFFDSGST